MRYIIDLPERLARRVEAYAAARQEPPEKATIALITLGLFEERDKQQPLSEEEAHAVLDALYGILADNPMPEVDDLPLQERPELDDL